MFILGFVFSCFVYILLATVYVSIVILCVRSLELFWYISYVVDVIICDGFVCKSCMFECVCVCVVSNAQPLSQIILLA